MEFYVIYIQCISLSVVSVLYLSIYCVKGTAAVDQENNKLIVIDGSIISYFMYDDILEGIRNIRLERTTDTSNNVGQ